jgi:hypothetical protein
VSTSRPTLLLWCAAVVIVEAVAVAVVAVVNLVGALSQGKYNTTLLVGLELLLVLAIAALVATAVGLTRRSPRVRTPFVLAQIFALVMAYPLVRHGGTWLIPGILLASLAIAGLIIVFSPRGASEFN